MTVYVFGALCLVHGECIFWRLIFEILGVRSYLAVVTT